MSATHDRPLLTFAIAAFNQERFVREAELKAIIEPKRSV